MKPLKLLSMSILITSALLLSAARNVRAQNLLGPSQSLTKQRNETSQKTYADTKQSPSPTRAEESPSSINSPKSKPSPEKIGDYSNDNEDGLFSRVWAWIASTSAQGFLNFLVAAATIALAIFTGKLVSVTRDMHIATEAATKVAALALNANRPFLFVQEPTIHFYGESKSIRGFVKSIQALALGQKSDITKDPLSQSSIYKNANAQIAFDIKNRGKGVAIIESTRVRLVIGEGLIKKPGRKLQTIGRTDVQLELDMLDEGQFAKYFVPSFQMSLGTLSNIVDFTDGLLVVVLVHYRDVFRRSFVEPFRFTYKPPIRNAQGIVMTAGELLPHRRRVRP